MSNKEKYCPRCMRLLDADGNCEVCGPVGHLPTESFALKPGTVLDDRYLLGSVLGQGGFAITYIGRDQKLGTRVAIKEYYPNGYAARNSALSPNVTVTGKQREQMIQSGREKFLQEARILAEFQGEKGIVTVSDFFQENNTAYIVMEYLEGATLQQCLSLRRFAPETIITLMEPVFEALERMHKMDGSSITGEGERFTLHRDISPDNIMVCQDGKLKLMDFGAARQIQNLRGTQQGISVVLKQGYAPMEQYLTNGKQGPWTDIYALCATIYACITGKTPPSALDRSDRTVADPLALPSSLGVAIPSRLEQVLLCGMARNGQQRYQSMEELRSALAEAMRERDGVSYLQIAREQGDICDTEALQQTVKEATVRRQQELQAQNVQESLSAETNNTLPAKKEGGKKKRLVSGILTAVALVAAVGLLWIGLSGGKKDTSKQVREASETFASLQREAAASEEAAASVEPTAEAEEYRPVAPLPTYGVVQGIQLEEQQQFEDGAGMSVRSGIMCQETDEGFSFYSGYGQKTEGSYKGCKNIGGGFYTVTTGESGIGTTGLMSVDGRILIPCEASEITWVADQISSFHNGRYMKVIYTTEEAVSSDEDAFEIDGTKYKGTMRFYDVENRCFVGELELENGQAQAAQCGEDLGIYVPEKTAGRGYLYDEYGTLVNASREIGDYGNGYYLSSLYNIYSVYDCNNGLWYQSAYALSSLTSTSGYLKEKRDGLYAVIDMSGTQILPDTYEKVYDEYFGVFRVKTQEGSYALIQEDGTVLAESDNEITSVAPGYSCYQTAKGYTLVGPDGVLAEELAEKPDGAVAVKGGKALILSSGEFSLDLPGDTVKHLGTGLFAAENTKGSYEIYEAFSGTRLLEGEYDEAEGIDGFLYVRQGASWTAYQIQQLTEQ